MCARPIGSGLRTPKVPTKDGRKGRKGRKLLRIGMRCSYTALTNTAGCKDVTRDGRQHSQYFHGVSMIVGAEIIGNALL